MQKTLLMLPVLFWLALSSAHAAPPVRPFDQDADRLCFALRGAFETMDKEADAFLPKKLETLPAADSSRIRQSLNNRYNPDGVAEGLFVNYWYLNNKILDNLQAVPLATRKAARIRDAWVRRMRQADAVFSGAQTQDTGDTDMPEFVRSAILQLKQAGADIDRCINRPQH